MTDIALQKADLRKKAFEARKTARSADREAAAATHLLTLLAGDHGKPMSGYMPIRTEINPVPVMAAMAAFGPVAVPVIQGAGQGLLFHEWTPGAKMVDGPFGAQVPESVKPVIPQVLIVPLVAFDAQCMRLGYGGGFYDRTLEKLRENGLVKAIGYAFAGQKVDALPLEPTDQSLDAVVTEDGVVWPIEVALQP